MGGDCLADVSLNTCEFQYLKTAKTPLNHFQYAWSMQIDSGTAALSA